MSLEGNTEGNSQQTSTDHYMWSNLAFTDTISHILKKRKGKHIKRKNYAQLHRFCVI